MDGAGDARIRAAPPDDDVTAQRLAQRRPMVLVVDDVAASRELLKNYLLIDGGVVDRVAAEALTRTR